MRQLLDAQDMYLEEYKRAKKAPRMIQFAGGAGGGAVVSGVLVRPRSPASTAAAIPFSTPKRLHSNRSSAAAVMIASGVDPSGAGISTGLPQPIPDVAELVARAGRATKLIQPSRLLPAVLGPPAVHHEAMALVNVASAVSAGGGGKGGGGGSAEDLSAVLYGQRRLVTEPLPVPQAEGLELHSLSDWEGLPSSPLDPQELTARPSRMGRRSSSSRRRASQEKKNPMSRSKPSKTKNMPGSTLNNASPSFLDAGDAITPHEFTSIPLSKAAQYLLSLEPLPLTINMGAATVTGRSSQVFNDNFPPLGVKAGEIVVPPLHTAKVSTTHIIERMIGFDVLWEGPRGEHEVLSWLLKEYMKTMKQRIDSTRLQQYNLMKEGATAGSNSGGDSRRRKGKK